jgi:Rhodopirellula transposase DDE domain
VRGEYGYPRHNRGATIERQPYQQLSSSRSIAATLRTTGGRPLTDHATIIDLIAATTTKRFEAVLDTTVHQKGIKITKSEMKRLNIRGDAFHPGWNSLWFRAQNRSSYYTANRRGLMAATLPSSGPSSVASIRMRSSRPPSRAGARLGLNVILLMDVYDGRTAIQASVTDVTGMNFDASVK